MTKRLFLIAGAALSVGTLAQAQTLDQGRAYRSELLSDASTRTSSLAPAAQDFTPAVHGYEQFRFDWNKRDDSSLDVADNKNTVGFQNARTRLNVSGNIANENWGYFIQFGFGDIESGGSLLDRGGSFSSSSGAFLEDAYGWYKMGNGWSTKFGQFKLPLFREELVGDTYQLFIDRSVINSGFNQGRSQGVEVSYEGDQFHFAGAFSDGLGSANTDFNSSAEADWALTARGEFKWAGDWKQAKDFTSFQNSQYFGMVGGALHYQNGGDTVGTINQNATVATVDVSMEGNGWNLFAAAIYSHLDPLGGGANSDWAFQIQGGIFVSADWELVAGYDVLVPDSNHGNPGDSNFSTFRVGANHYIIPESHALKVSIDLTWFLDNPTETAIVVPSTGAGLLPSNKDGQWNIAGQIQLTF